ncbi:hypothetical protein CXZ10_15805 [Pleomorphomonas diazotrophica]|uniref:Uncharacterized protein n=1 Tax=Pleomorphomonas diazotrophica TaxID=1166257 RepID=A0A1I4W0E8_9HYPH|nr:hypothetical protein [Pleomorphomonas diazotrophica]PKR88259.1 hypothetical protein CXZ10_15805 [Pleomorphomonas diazotrophica]SFN06609.1 hypothetical protein SAMN05192571_11437 [Pleomorphomonas diazotrophica]
MPFRTRKPLVVTAISAAVWAMVSLVLTTGSQAGTPEDDYLSARKVQTEIVRQAEAAQTSEAELTRLEQAGRQELERRLLAVFGHGVLPTDKGEPVFEPETLYEEEIGFGSVDGLRFSVEEGQATYFYSTDGIVKAWAERRSDDSELAQALESGIPGIIKSETFMSNAVTTDAAAVDFLDLPVKTDAGVAARAFAGLLVQDAPAMPPDTLFLAVSKRGIVVAVAAQPKTVVKDPEECAAAKEDYDSPNKYTDCVSDALKASPQYSALAKEAQGLVDAVVSRLP